MKNYKNFKNIYILLLSVILFTGCDNSLDEIVYSTITEKTYNYTANDFAPNIVGAYAPMYENDVFGRWQTQELTGCCIALPANVTGWDDGGVYKKLMFHTWNSEAMQIGQLWDKSYRGAILCNSAISRLENNIIPAPSEEERLDAIAELRALRAYYYWMICDNFGDAPLVITTSQELPEKSTRQEIYNFIVDELTEVIPDLSEVQGAELYGRFNKWAAKTLLANIYINAEVYTGVAKWNECIQECNDIINSGKCELSPDYKDPFKIEGSETSKEVLFTIPYDYDRGIVGNFLFMNSWHSELQKKYETVYPPNAAGGPKGVTQFIDTYQAGDIRLQDSWLMGQQYDSEGNMLYGIYDKAGEPLVFSKDLPDGKYTNEMEGYRMGKYEIAVGSQWSADSDIPLFRYAEVLLMKAECLLRTGQAGAGALVTEVRNRAFKDNPELAIVTDDQLKENSAFQWGLVEDYVISSPGDQSAVEFGRMFDEWNWEFAWEGYTRRNMIRFGVFTSKSWLSHEPNGDYRSVFPIPESVITSNPLLDQNPNY
ncbi:RagB/SusD family nutrient uptake outer membrane protein [Plebeiibacterium sediminum]|uniref:RagB/SusD family nutrient uptake outer membrane protein n=1 Tax=Plebeiibacterium sediminum TaxID=2992112 RepID=A0AAE3M984_9BACT|nr:RagB/SusD family nutrient uptake outer membrane protein [Plebeiobacterium sediminum]MCW3788935.1 RagB/SusD family nutrient uptake outer membrane protein [Plebeiobacterium sediminum]